MAPSHIPGSEQGIFCVTDPIILPEIFIPDPKNSENFETAKIR